MHEVSDQATAEQVYLASRIAVDPDTGAENKAHVDFLAARLETPPDRLNALNTAV